ncbi:MAG: hypothetical protein PHN29_06235 [Endomicrobiaceae bacterium]|jgi:hypothetical protein|nr:hypothetical protein [Endomicrobiaceae bacterium]
MAVKKSVKTAVTGKEVEKKKSVAKSIKKFAAKKPAVSNPEPKKQEQVKETVTNSNSYVLIDHPCEKENITSSEYVIRIGASMDGYVEISFNDAEWEPCRFASGYWWFDWRYYKPGNVKISARLVSNEGQILKLSDARKCKVI